MSDYVINYYRFCPVSEVNGPGKRAVIWVQGCKFRCPGCFNKESWSFIDRCRESVLILRDRILQIEGIEGVTFSGGEPMLQAGVLAKLASELQKQGLSVLTYTGFTWDELHTRIDEETNELLIHSDIVITGRFDENLPPDKMWVGSANQKVHFLSSRYIHLFHSITHYENEFEIQIEKTGKVMITGFIEKQTALVLGTAK